MIIDTQAIRSSEAIGVSNPRAITRSDSLTTLRVVENTTNCLTQNLRQTASASNINQVLKFNFLSGANLRGQRLSKINFKGFDLSRTNLSRTNLSRTNLSRTNLSGANLSGANLRGANLRGANLRGANLRGADLRAADLIDAYLSGADLSGAQLEGVRIRLKLPVQWADWMLDENLNHEANNGFSLLLTINSIDNKYADTKRWLVCRFLDSIDKPEIDLRPYLSNFCCLLHPIYFADERIKQFFVDQITKQLIDYANSQPWTGVSKNGCKACLNYIELIKDFDLIANNGFFVQLILNSMSINDKEVNEQAKALYEKYLSHPSIQPITQHDFFGSGERKVDWSDLGEANNFVLMNAPYIMMIAKNDLVSLLYPTVDTQWDRFFLFDEGYKDDKGNLITIADSNRPPSDQLFKTFRIFDSPYQFAQKRERFIKLLALLELGEYQQNFVSALQAKASSKKMVDAKDQTALREIFGKVLKTTDSDNKPLALEDYRLRAEHYAQIERQFELTDCDPKIKAQTLFALAAVFAKYSSSNFLGTEYDSPEYVRYYAYALLKKAKELDPNIMTDEQFTDWKNRFFGLEGAFTCTAVLSNIMVGYARGTERATYPAGHGPFPKVIDAILPLAWK